MAFDFFVAKSKKDLRKLLETQRNFDHETMGKLLGYPLLTQKLLEKARKMNY